MARRSRLKGGAPRLMGNHSGSEGKAYRHVYDALEAECGPLSALGKLEAGRAAIAWVQLQASTRALATAQRKHRTGRGRRPSPRDIERLARRAGLADATYAQALDKFRQLCSERKRPTNVRELMATTGGRS